MGPKWRQFGVKKFRHKKWFLLHFFTSKRNRGSDKQNHNYFVIVYSLLTIRVYYSTCLLQYAYSWFINSTCTIRTSRKDCTSLTFLRIIPKQTHRHKRYNSLPLAHDHHRGRHAKLHKKARSKIHLNFTKSSSFISLSLSHTIFVSFLKS